MDTIKILKDLGLSNNEAAAYAALLELGPSPVLLIAKRAGLKRPTTYLILDQLMVKGLVALVPQEKKKLFLALSPERLKEQIDRRARIINQTLPELEALYKTQTQRPTIRFFESTEGIIQAYREITTTSTKELLSVFAMESIPKEFQIALQLFTDSFQLGDKHGREIISAANRKHPYIQTVRKLPNYEMRFAGADQKFFTDNVIAGDKVAIFSFKKRFALVIESEDVANSMRSLFELAWQATKK